ncbi:hypothetical protein Tco_0201114 [Tanacetum coccineum]
MESSSSNSKEMELQQINRMKGNYIQNALATLISLKSSRYILEISIVLPLSLTQDYLKLHVNALDVPNKSWQESFNDGTTLEACLVTKNAVLEACLVNEGITLNDNTGVTESSGTKSDNNSLETPFRSEDENRSSDKERSSTEENWNEYSRKGQKESQKQTKPSTEWKRQSQIKVKSQPSEENTT